jgi:hypothetical protein
MFIQKKSPRNLFATVQNVRFQKAKKNAVPFDCLTVPIIFYKDAPIEYLNVLLAVLEQKVTILKNSLPQYHDQVILATYQLKYVQNEIGYLQTIAKLKKKQAELQAMLANNKLMERMKRKYNKVYGRKTYLLCA